MNLSQNPFQNCTLFASLRSPYARRVRVAFLEHGLTYHEVMEDVFKPTQRLLRTNPLGRVPVVELTSGVKLCESQMILNGFYGKIPPVPELALSGLMLGLCDKIVERLLESLRPKDHQDPEIFLDFEKLLPETLAQAEAFALKHSDLPQSPILPQAAIDLGVSLGYLNLRVSDQWQRSFPGCKKFLSRLSDRPSFQRTQPPLPT